MRKTSLIVLGASLGLTVLFVVIWFGGLVVGQTFGGMLHLLLILAMFTSIGVIIGTIMLIISYIKK